MLSKREKKRRRRKKKIIKEGKEIWKNKEKKEDKKDWEEVRMRGKETQKNRKVETEIESLENFYVNIWIEIQDKNNRLTNYA